MGLRKGARIHDRISYSLAATPQQRCELVDCNRCVKAAATAAAAAAASTRIGTSRHVGREGEERGGVALNNTRRIVRLNLEHLHRLARARRHFPPEYLYFNRRARRGPVNRRRRERLTYAKWLFRLLWLVCLLASPEKVRHDQ